MKFEEVYVCKVRRHDPSGVRERKWEVDMVIFHCVHEWNSLRRMNESYVLSNLPETQLPKVEICCSMGWHSMFNKGEKKRG